MKKIRFDLPIDGTTVSNIKELREHLTIEIIGHFRRGVLGNWLESRRELTLLAEVKELKRNDEARTDDAVALRELCRIFEVEADEATIKAAVARPTGIPGIRLRTQKEFLEWFVATTHYLSRLMSPRSGVADLQRVHFEFALPDAPASTDPGEWSAYVVEFVNHCRIVIEVLKGCPDRAFAETLTVHLSDHINRVLRCFDGVTADEYDAVPAKIHVDEAQLPIRMEPLRPGVRTSGRTRITDLRWSSTGAIDNVGDVDWWCFSVLRRGKVMVQTVGGLNTVGALEDGSGRQIYSDTHSGRGGNFKIVRTLDPGTYYIRVSGFAGHTGTYTLDVRHVRSSKVDGDDNRTQSPAAVAVNQSVSRALAMADRHRQEVFRNLSKEHLRELEGVAGFSDSNGAKLVRAWPVSLANHSALTNRVPSTSEVAADGDSAGGASVLGILELAARGISGTATDGVVRALADALSDSPRRRLTDDQKTALQAFAQAFHENGAQLVRRVCDTGLLPSGSDSGDHGET